MKKQNHKVFKELLSYLIKNKFLIGMTEIKLTKTLRKRLYGLMEAFSTLKHHQINFIDPNATDLIGEDLLKGVNEQWLDQQAMAEPRPTENLPAGVNQNYPDIDQEDSQDVTDEKTEPYYKSKLKGKL